VNWRKDLKTKNSYFHKFACLITDDTPAIVNGSNDGIIRKVNEIFWREISQFSWRDLCDLSATLNELSNFAYFNQ
jgi:hypothetical protein